MDHTQQDPDATPGHGPAHAIPIAAAGLALAIAAWISGPARTPGTALPAAGTIAYYAVVVALGVLSLARLPSRAKGPWAAAAVPVAACFLGIPIPVWTSWHPGISVWFLVCAPLSGICLGWLLGTHTVRALRLLRANLSDEDPD